MIRKDQGESLEHLFSGAIHRREDGYPLLVSPQVLRSRQLGQIDIAFYLPKKEQILCFEVKSNGVLSSVQRLRIYQAQHFLGLCLDSICILEILGKEDLLRMGEKSSSNELEENNDALW